MKFGQFLAWRAGANSRYRTGESPLIKAEHQGIIPHLGTACEIHHIYEELNESSSARPGRSQQLEIPPSLDSKQAAFSNSAGLSSNAGFFYGCEYFTWRGDFNAGMDFTICLFFSSREDFSICRDFGTRLDLPSAMIFGSATFSTAAIFSACAVFLYMFFSAIILIIFHIFIGCVPVFRAM
jgi:hypothetical protein